MDITWFTTSKRNTEKRNISDLLTYLREKRNFNETSYLEEKCKKINSFFSNSKLDAAVVGISGGIDSAVTIALLKAASNEKDSPIKNILGVIAPIHGDGTSNQDSAENKAKRFMIMSGIKFVITDLSSAYKELINSGDTDKIFSPWANGQMASILRTPMFYYQAALQQTLGYKSIVVGTTNRDEGSYIGFFGKASDAAVDLQPIADLHKSEVYKIAKLLNVSQEIIDATPAGDVYDSKVDEEMIGAPYDFLELYLLMKEYSIHPSEYLIESDFNTYKHFANNIEILHSKNSHKYKVGNPAHFIDIMSRKIPGGWN